jgi:hypothetical protein
VYLPLVTYSLRTPLEGLSFLQRLLWPLIYAQLWTLKLWVREHYGRGVPYRIVISPFGVVRLVRLPMDATWSYAAPGALEVVRFEFSAGIATGALRLACAPEESPDAPPLVPFVRTGITTVAAQRLGLDTS